MADDKPKGVRGPGGKFVKNVAPPAQGQTTGQMIPPATKAPPEAEATSAGSQGDQVESNFIWAARQIVNGRTVRRECWIGAKSIGTADPSRNILENEDFLANDWVLV